MRAARWLVIATALVAAGAAFHLLMSPGGGSRSGSRSRDSGSSGSSWTGDRSAGGARSGGPATTGRSGDSASGGRSSSGSAPRGERPLDEIDAESREAMRNFLRESAKDGE